MQAFRNLSTSLAALIGACGLAACGDNILPGGNPTIDASDIDGGGDDIDAGIDGGLPAADTTATIAVTDVTLTEPTAAGLGFRGGSISIVFTDLTEGGGTEVFRGSPGAPIGSCLITQFGPTSGLPGDTLDADTITISGDGLLKPVGPCAFAGGAYTCRSHGGAAQTVAAVDNAGGAGTVAYAWVDPAAPFPVTPANALHGSWLVINGFEDDLLNSGAAAFPIGAQPSTSQLIAVNQAATAGTAAPEDDISYAVLNGFAPTPGGPDYLAADADVTVTKDANGVWPAIDLTTDVMGDGFELDETSAQPHAFPFETVDAPIRYSCDNNTAGDTTDDTCGDDSETTLKAFILSGRATKKPVAGLLPFQMPTEDGATEWMEWQCAILFGKSVTMPMEAVNEIVDFEPTRVEMRILNVAGHLVSSPDPTDGPNTMRVLVGHGVVGHTTAP